MLHTFSSQPTKLLLLKLGEEFLGMASDLDSRLAANMLCTQDNILYQQARQADLLHNIHQSVTDWLHWQAGSPP